MNLSKMKKNDLMSELKKRNLSTEGLKDELKDRLMAAIENEEASIDESEGTKESDEGAIESEQEKESDNENQKQNPDPTALTIEDTLNMKQNSTANESYSMIVNVTEDSSSEYNTGTIATEGSKAEDETTSRLKNDIDNGEHEVIEVNEDVSIDGNVEDRPEQSDRDNEEVDYNEDSEVHNFAQNDNENDCEVIENSEDLNEDLKEEFVLLVHNIPNDTKATELKDLFSQHAKILSTKIAKKANDISDNCFGFISVENFDDINKCIDSLNNTDFKGQRITVTTENKMESETQKPIRASSIASSSESWGGSKKCTQAKSRSGSVKAKSHSGSPKKATNTWGDSDDEKNICAEKTYSPRKSNSPKNDDFPRRDFRGGRRDFRGRGGGRRGFQGDRGRGGYRGGDRYRNDDDDYRPKSYGGSRDYDRGNDRRDRRDDNYRRRDDRDDYSSRFGRFGDSRRDNRYEGRGGGGSYRNTDYSDKPRKYDDRDSKYGGGGGNYRMGKYDAYDRKEGSYRKDRNLDKRDDDYKNPKRDYHMKRTRVDDDYYPGKRRREDFSPSMRRDKFNRSSPPPRRREYDNEREYRKPDFRPRDQDGGYYKASRNDYPVRKHDEYGGDRRRQYEASPSERRTSRNRDNYAKPQVEFGGRSRHYD